MTCGSTLQDSAWRLVRAWTRWIQSCVDSSVAASWWPVDLGNTLTVDSTLAIVVDAVTPLSSAYKWHPSTGPQRSAIASCRYVRSSLATPLISIFTVSKLDWTTATSYSPVCRAAIRTTCSLSSTLPHDQGRFQWGGAIPFKWHFW